MNKGIAFERLLAKYQRQYSRVFRIAASGHGGVGSPDLVLGRNGTGFAIECKVTKFDKIVVDKYRHHDFITTAYEVGLIPLYIIKFNKNVYMFRANFDTRTFTPNTGKLVNIKLDILDQFFAVDAYEINRNTSSK